MNYVNFQPLAVVSGMSGIIDIQLTSYYVFLSLFSVHCMKYFNISAMYIIICVCFKCIFSETVLFLHQIFLKGLMARMENWPTLVLGEYTTLVLSEYTTLVLGEYTTLVLSEYTTLVLSEYTTLGLVSTQLWAR